MDEAVRTAMRRLLRVERGEIAAEVYNIPSSFSSPRILSAYVERLIAGDHKTLAIEFIRRHSRDETTG